MPRYTVEIRQSDKRLMCRKFNSGLHNQPDGEIITTAADRAEMERKIGSRILAMGIVSWEIAA